VAVLNSTLGSQVLFAAGIVLMGGVTGLTAVMVVAKPKPMTEAAMMMAILLLGLVALVSISTHTRRQFRECIAAGLENCMAVNSNAASGFHRFLEGR
jgi:divalent metal cation (Fe/Co/Zn/Cd) transporter